MIYEFKTKPYEHQLRCWNESKDELFWALMLDMGLGKSKVLLDTAGYLYEANKIDGLAIVAPNGCIQDWYDSHVPTHLPDRIAREHVEWSSDPSKTLQKKLRGIFKATPGRLNILSMNIEAILGKVPLKMLIYFLQHHRAMLAIDESTTIGNPKAKRTKTVLDTLAPLAPYRRIMTGDGAPNSPLTMYSQGEFLERGALGHSNFFSFKTDYCHLVPMKGAGGRTFHTLDPKQGQAGYRNLDRLREKVSKIASIIKKSDCLDLPEKIYLAPRQVEMGAKQAKAYKEMERQAVAYLSETIAVFKKGMSWEELCDERAATVWKCFECGAICSAGADHCVCCGSRAVGIPEAPASFLDSQVTLDTSDMASANLVITQLLRLHQIACGFIVTDDHQERGFDETNPRLEALLDVLEETSGKVVIWNCYRRNLLEINEAIGKKFGKDSVVMYDGHTSDDARRAAKLAFQDPKSPVRFFDANMATGKYGLTLTAGRTAIYYANSYDREARMQSEDRIHRIGQTCACSYLDIIARGTVDERFPDILKGKAQLSELVAPSNWKNLFNVRGKIAA